MISYIVQVSISWIFFYGVYHLFLKKETFFNINRYYLMGSLILSLFIPQIGELLSNWFTTSPADAGNVVYFISEAPLIIENAMSSQTPSLSWVEWTLLMVYLTGMLIVGTKFTLGLRRIFKLYTSGLKKDKGSFILVETDGVHLPFSFFQYVFISKKIPLQKHIEKIIRHELTHVEKMHSVDILLIEALHIFFWFNPILLLYKKAIRQSHEYQADASVLHGTDIKNYGQILLGQSTSGLEVALANQFFNSQIKNRITMMYQKKSTRSALIKYLAAIPVLIFTAFIFSNATQLDHEMLPGGENSEIVVSSSDTIPPPPPPPPPPKEAAKAPKAPAAVPPPPPPPPPVEDLVSGTFGQEVFSVAEQMPRFPGCENMSGAQRDDCSKKKMMEYIASNLKYPENAKKEGIEGTAIVQFVIGKNGKISSVNVLRDVNSTFGAAAKKVIESMNSMPESWTPGVQNGKKVNVSLTLTINFKLPDDEFKVKRIEDLDAPDKVKMDIKNIFKEDQPLVILNDVEVPREVVEDINPDNIEMINVLKGKSAIAKYGDKASDGAIEIFTKEKIDASKEHTSPMKIKLTQGDQEPLIVLDGIIIKSDIKNNISPDDIESIDVLKGEKATEKYGDKGKNGVVEITSKGDNSIKLKADKIVIKDSKANLKADKIRFEKERKEDLNTELEESEGQPLYIVDGEERKIDKDNDLDPNSIKSVTVLKGEKATEKYGDKGKNGVVEITLKAKAEKAENVKIRVPGDMDPLYIVDGKEKKIDKDKDLDPNTIKSINVLKGDKAKEKYGDKGKNGVVEITTLSSEQAANKVYNEVDVMPRFPGCEDGGGSDAEKEECSKKELLTFVYKNIKYPKEARDEGIEGMNVVQFTVKKDGSVDDIKVLRSIGGGTDEAVLSVMDQMILMDEKWTPGMKDGKPVNVQYTLPIRFKLEGKTKKSQTATKAKKEEKTIKGKLLDETVVVGYQDQTLNSNLTEGEFLSELKVYPNPANEEFTVEVRGDQAPLEIRVHDMAGKLLLQQSIEDFNGYYKGTLRNENFINTQAIISFVQNGKVQSQKILFSK